MIHSDFGSNEEVGTTQICTKNRPSNKYGAENDKERLISTRGQLLQ